MGKKNKGQRGPNTTAGAVAAQNAVATTVTTEAVVTDAGTEKAKVVPGICRVKAGGKLRGARDAWYQRLLKYDGKPLAEYEADCRANPPSMPTKGALAGKGEPPSGWVSWFKRNGFLTVEAPAKADGEAQPTA